MPQLHVGQPALSTNRTAWLTESFRYSHTSIPSSHRPQSMFTSTLIGTKITP